MTICGMKDQVSEPDLKSPESWSLVVPMLVVSAMRGKKAARAAPMFRVGRPQLSFGLQDVGAALQHLGGQAGGEVAGRRHAVQRVGQKLGGHRGPDQEPQRVLVEGHLARVPGDVDPRRVRPGLGLAQVEIGRSAHLGAAADHLVGLQLRLEGRPGQLEVFAVRGKGEVDVGHLGQQRDLRANSGLLHGEVLLEGRIAEIADAAEEIDLPLADRPR
jgi:hypothetical protein